MATSKSDLEELVDPVIKNWIHGKSKAEEIIAAKLLPDIWIWIWNISGHYNLQECNNPAKEKKKLEIYI